MMVFLRCVGEALVAQGMRGLLGLAPFGEQVYNVAANAIERYRLARREQQVAADVQEVVQADMAQIRTQAHKIAQDVGVGRSEDEVGQIEAYLTQISGVARQSLRRPQDPSGTTVPASLNLADPIQLAGLLPRRPPRFRLDDAMPHAPQWRFVELLGSGGFGEVWLVRHTWLDQCRAVKFCLDPAARERLLRHELEIVKRVMSESKQLKSNEHGIVPLVDACLEGETPWLAYEYVAGGDLAGLIRHLQQAAAPQRAEQALDILRILSGIVGRFHRLAQPIIHRDLKPANILLTKDRLLRITDFGISHVAADQEILQATISTPSLSLGATYRGAHTPIYASPQQKKGMKADVRDDVHALGIIGYQLLLADLGAERPAGKWRKRVADCGLSEAILDLLESCWDDDPDERPRDALALAEALASARSASDTIEPKPTPSAKAPLPQPEPTGPTADPVTDYSHWKQQIEELKTKSQRAADVFDYARAVAILETVPSKHRDEARLAEWTRKRDQLKEAWERVESDWKDMTEDDLHDHLENVLALHPDHPRAKPWLAEVSKSARQQQRRRLYRGKIGDTIEVPLTEALRMKFAWVPPGQSWLGGVDGKPGTEEFTLVQGLWCGVYPVTQAEWQAVMGNNPSRFAGNSRHPVEKVSWNHLQEFLQKLNSRLTDGGLMYRLPSAEEWEYICRGGPISQAQSAYHFYFSRSETDLASAPTNDLSSVQANFDGNYPAGSAFKGPYLQATSEVGLYLPNPLGIYDLHGNVWEWTSTLKGSSRLFLGGSWRSHGVHCTASPRLRLEPILHPSLLGFRVLAVPSGAK